MKQTYETATFAGGCFWCTEAIFKRLKGVQTVTSGYAGGSDTSPSYSLVSSGSTGHAEAITITFDPTIISYETLLDIFWATHDPTTKDQQGADRGTQYRSVIFYHTDEQRQTAIASQEKLEQEKKYPNPIVTEIVPYTHFYPAESYHQNYYEENRSKPYCMVVIDPKIRKLMDTFTDKVKEEYQKD